MSDDVISSPERERPAAPEPLPPELSALAEGRTWRRNLVGEAGATVHRLSLRNAPDLYLKHGRGDVAQDIADEAARLRWLAAHVATPQVAHVSTRAKEAWLLTTALPGRTAYEVMAADRAQAPVIVDRIAAFLRKLHAIPLAQCPFDSGPEHRLKLAYARMHAGLVDPEDFDDTHEGWTAQQVWDEMIALRPTHLDRVVTHGDYSLDNILIADGEVSGCIDVGRLGVADRYQDLAIAWNCFDEFGSDLQARFLAAYDVAELDEAKLRFHLDLDEFF
jgi:aminoglycoside 3'-phosphotransferase-1